MEAPCHQRVHYLKGGVHAGRIAAGFYEEVDSLRTTLTALVGREEFMLRPPYGMMNFGPSSKVRAT